MRRPLPIARLLVLLATLPFGSGCDVVGPFELDLGGVWGGGSVPPTEVIVSAPVHVGTYPAVHGEAVLRLYPSREANPSQLVDSVISDRGEYRFFLGKAPGSEVCDYWVHVERWDGTPVEPVDLIPDAAAPCELEPGSYDGTPVSLPGYDELTEPFVLTGQVFVDGDSAAAAGIPVTIPLRPAGDGYHDAEVVVGDDGRWEYSTTHGAERYRFCAGAEAAVEDPTYGGLHWEYLDRLSSGGCTLTREFRAVRFGQLLAVRGTVFRDQRSDERVGAGEVRLQLLDADSTAYGDPVVTSDDGGFDLWLEPGDDQDVCEWLVRAEMDGRDPLLVPLNGSGYCSVGADLDLDFGM